MLPAASACALSKATRQVSALLHTSALTNEAFQDFVLSVALTPHGDWVLSGSKDRGVQFWDPHTGVAQLMLQGHKNSGMFPSLSRTTLC
jgi:WD40 repeat protein